MTALQTRIVAARTRYQKTLKPSDLAVLERLQDEFRKSGAAIRYGGSVRVIDGPGGPVTPIPSARRSAGAPTAKRPGRSWKDVPALVPYQAHAAPDFKVILDPRAAEKILSWRDPFEDGGWLIGRRHASAQDSVEITDSMWRAHEDDRRPSSLDVWFQEGDRIEESLDLRGRIVGHWHSQPVASQPSGEDFGMWRRALNHFGSPYFVGLVIRHGVDSLEAPSQARAYVFTEDLSPDAEPIDVLRGHEIRPATIRVKARMEKV